MRKNKQHSATRVLFSSNSGGVLALVSDSPLGDAPRVHTKRLQFGLATVCGRQWEIWVARRASPRTSRNRTSLYESTRKKHLWSKSMGKRGVKNGSLTRRLLGGRRERRRCYSPCTLMMQMVWGRPRDFPCRIPGYDDQRHRLHYEMTQDEGLKGLKGWFPSIFFSFSPLPLVALVALVTSDIHTKHWHPQRSGSKV